MTRVADIREQAQALDIQASLLGKKCWDVGCGAAAGSSFSLSFGKKLLQCPPSTSAKAVEKYGQFERELKLLVWCSWTLNNGRGPVTSSDDETPGLEKGLRRLSGRTVQSAEIGADWYLRLAFSGGMMLTIFPDHVGPAASFDGNWELWRQRDAYIVETDLSCKVIPRDYPPLEVPSDARWKRQAGREQPKGKRAAGGRGAA